MTLAKATIQKELSLQFAINPPQFVRKSMMHNERFFSTEFRPTEKIATQLQTTDLTRNYTFLGMNNFSW